MAKAIRTNYEFGGNELENVSVQKLTTDPAAPVEGQFWGNTTDNKFCVRLGGVTYRIPASGVTMQAGDPVPAAGNAGQWFYNTTNNTMKYSDGAQLVELADFITADSTHTLTNKTIDANGTGNSITNLEVADFLPAAVDTDGTGAAVNATSFWTSLAAKTYVDSNIIDADVIKVPNDLDASANPNYPASDAGDSYRISVAGKIGGAAGLDVNVGDWVIAKVDGIAAGDHATVGPSYLVIEDPLAATVDASTTAKGIVELADQAEAQARTDTARALTPASVADFARRYEANVTLVANTPFNIPVATHGLGAGRKSVTTYLGDAEVSIDVNSPASGVVTLQSTSALTIDVVIEG